VKDMATSIEYRHVSTVNLAMLAQRLGKVFASPSTWHRLVRKNGWRPPRRRVPPQKPKLGVRASSPDGIWHVDTSVVRLLDGSRAYLYAVIENFSRRILAWRAWGRFDPMKTMEVLVEAGRGARHSEASPTLLADAGIENRNQAVDDLVSSGAVRRVLAQTEIWCSSTSGSFSTSLDTAESVHRLDGIPCDRVPNVEPQSWGARRRRRGPFAPRGAR